MGTQSSETVTREQAIDRLAREYGSRFEKQMRIKLEGLSDKKLEDLMDEEFIDVFTNYLIGYGE